MKHQFAKYACMAVGLFSIAVIPASLHACDPAGKGSPKERAELTPEQREEMRKKHAEGFAEKLGLDDSQKEQIQAIMEEQREELKALKDDESLSKEEKMAKFKEIAGQTREKMAEILTEEQKAKLAEMKKHFGGPGKHRGPKDGDGDKAAPVPTAPAPTA